MNGERETVSCVLYHEGTEKMQKISQVIEYDKINEETRLIKVDERWFRYKERRDMHTCIITQERQEISKHEIQANRIT